MAAKLYYLDAGNPAGYHTTDQYIQYGHTPANVGFIFSQLNVLPYDFSRGFQLPDGSYLLDNQGNKLDSYFGFQFKTNIVLSNSDSPGYYQLATLSDDGSSIRIINSDGTLDSLVEAEGDHSVELGCASKAISFDSSTRLPVQINWHQGPPVRIAIMMLWRRVSGSYASLQDSHCGIPKEDYYFDVSTVPSTPLQPWYDLQANGWKVLAPGNFIMPDNQTNSCSNK